MTKDHLKKLDQLAVRLTKLERFAEAIEVTKEIKILTDSENPPPVKSDFPPKDLILLQSSYRKDLEEIDSKMDRIYVENLKKLQRESAKSGDLASVLAYRNEAQLFSKSTSAEESPLPKTKAGLKSWLVGTKWAPVGNESNVYVFTKKGGFISPEFQPTFKVTGSRSILVTWPNNISIECRFDPKLTKLSETNGATNVFKRVMEGG